VFRVGPAVDRYVERIVLWRAASFDGAIGLADADAHRCADREGLEYVGYVDGYYLIELHHDRPGHDDEVFSMMRDSQLPADEYVARYYTAGDAGPLSVPESAGPGWYTVRRVVRWPQYLAYEERVTLWYARSAAHAIAASGMASRRYAEEIIGGGTDVGFAQCHHLGPDRPGVGDEVFAHTRASNLDPLSYLEEFFETGDERGSFSGSA
jgi:hypothetical protein